MMKETLLLSIVFVSMVKCKSVPTIDNDELEIDMAYITEKVKKMTKDISCDPNPCKNGGTCFKVPEGNLTCICTSPFFGKYCEKAPCTPNPCQNDGNCYLKNEDDYVCLCKEPFTGERCEKSLCTPNPCRNGGNCTINGKHSSCLCRSAYFGEYCEKDLCSEVPCENNGECIIERNNFKCKCKSPFFGEKCEKDLCSSNPCKNDGRCTLDGSTFRCECKSPYEGKQCENGESTESDISMTTSSDSTMTRKVTESTVGDNWTSSESSIFTLNEKATTTLDINSTNDILSTTLAQGFCKSDSDCLNGGTCRKNREDEHTCDCVPNFGGTTCEVNLLCVSIDQSCRIINAVCVIIDNHAICECPNGTLYHRKSGLCEDICDPRKCVHGKCEIIGKTYKCNCDQGYTGSHCDEKERSNHENFVPWFTVIASINLFVCLLLIGVFCMVCQMNRFIRS